MGVDCSRFSYSNGHLAVPSKRRKSIEQFRLFFISMTKKEYTKPYLEVVRIDTNSILAGSGVTGATGEDAPWASAKRKNYEDEIFWDEDEY